MKPSPKISLAKQAAATKAANLKLRLKKAAALLEQTRLDTLAAEQEALELEQHLAEHAEAEAQLEHDRATVEQYQIEEARTVVEPSSLEVHQYTPVKKQRWLPVWVIVAIATLIGIYLLTLIPAPK
jgi:hypothetical protein